MGVKVAEEQINVIYKMDESLKDILQQDSSKLWENTFTKRQIDKRKSGEVFSLRDHIRAMVYSMLSSGTVWDRISSDTETGTGYISSVDEIFCNYKPEKLLECSPEQLRDKLKEIRCASQYTRKQMEALISVNIPKLMEFEKSYGAIDTYYHELIQSAGTMLPLIKNLSDSASKDKMAQMDVALVCEYLKNVGYDVAKPDRHIRRILGCDRLGYSEHKIVPVFEALDIVQELARKSQKSAAEVDYILWMYCAKGYGEICTKVNPECGRCVVKQNCNNIKEN